jgi:aminodeoxychorismate synthase component I
LNSVTAAVRERPLDLPSSAETLFGRLRDRSSHAVWFDGRGGFGQSWICGTMLALVCRPWSGPATPQEQLAALDRRIAERRTRGGTRRTGVVLLLGYEALDGTTSSPAALALPPVPTVVVIEVDRSLAELDDGRFLLTDRTPRDGAPHAEPQLEALCSGGPEPHHAPVSAVGPATTSLPRERYLQAVRRLKRHIAAGDVYQANLCQRFEVPVRGDSWEGYRRLAGRTPAPRSAYVETPALAVASVSPETFLRVEPPDRIETRPIKGTRARNVDPVRDRAAAAELLASEKDRAELLMIVDLERNDLGRICRTGSVEVGRPYELESYPSVHHLVARVRGRLRPEVPVSEMLRATFPGGSISGAPKIRARQLLAGIEPVPRGPFTGSLFWFGDDGSTDSSILIRTVVFAGGRASIGAGGGIVADSDPEDEWHESNLKARPATRALGFDPTDAR